MNKRVSDPFCLFVTLQNTVVTEITTRDSSSGYYLHLVWTIRTLQRIKCLLAGTRSDCSYRWELWCYEEREIPIRNTWKKITLLLPSGVPAGLNWEDAGRRGDVEIRDTSVLISAVQRGGNVPAGRWFAGEKSVNISVVSAAFKW